MTPHLGLVCPVNQSKEQVFPACRPAPCKIISFQLKSILFCIAILLSAMTGCKESNYAESKKPHSGKLELKIINASWFTKTEKLGHAMLGHVNLAVTGVTNANRIIVRAYGDGEISDRELKLSATGLFADSIEISFSYISTIPDHPIAKDSKTVIKLYSGSEVMDTTIYSGPLQYPEN